MLRADAWGSSSWPWPQDKREEPEARRTQNLPLRLPQSHSHLEPGWRWAEERPPRVSSKTWNRPSQIQLCGSHSWTARIQSQVLALSLMWNFGHKTETSCISDTGKMQIIMGPIS